MWDLLKPMVNKITTFKITITPKTRAIILINYLRPF